LIPSLSIQREVTVGYQPEEMEIVGNQLFVANSGGYRAPNYDNTVSVIDLNSFTEIRKLDVAINLHHIKKDNYGDLYVSSRGDYYDTLPAYTF
jgi:DNA-binding beta-propeller fold protein YncE